MEPSEVAAKAELRRHMFGVRHAIDDPDRRSQRIRTSLAGLAAIQRARVVLAYDALAGEPDLGPLLADLVARGVEVRVPEPVPTAAVADLDRVDVVIVPGVAFTATGDRLGRGAGWYDRVLAGLAHDAVSIGVCFEVQVVERIPTEPHDVAVQIVVTDADVVVAG